LILSTVCLTLLIGSVASAGTKSTVRFAVAGEGRALELGALGQGVTLGVAFAEADSTPSVFGFSAGQCTLLGDDPDPDDLPCNESTSEQVTLDDPGDGEQTCAGPSIPEPLGSVLSIDIACGNSSAALKKGLPTTTNRGVVGDLALELNVAPLSEAVEDTKDQIVDTIQGIIGGAPEPVKNAVNQLLDVVDEGQAVHISLGPSTADVRAIKGGIGVLSTAAGVRIGLLGIPDLDADGVPIVGSSDALEDGLVIIDVGSSSSQVDLFSETGKATAVADPALVRVKVRDITKLEPTYVEVAVAPGETVTILGGTPAESTIVAADSLIEEGPGSATAASNAVRLHLLKGLQGGIELALGRTTAAGTIEVTEPEVLPKDPVENRPPKILPVTGGTDLTMWGLLLLVGASAATLVRRRMRA
jgi:hypothetical protein